MLALCPLYRCSAGPAGFISVSKIDPAEIGEIVQGEVQL